MRIKILILLLFAAFGAQGQSYVNLGGSARDTVRSKGSLRVDSVMRCLGLINLNGDDYKLTTDANGFFVLRPDLGGSLGSDNQQLTISNDTIFLEDGGYVVLPASGLTYDTTYLYNYIDSLYNDAISQDDTGTAQTLVLNYPNLQITGGNTVVFPDTIPLSRKNTWDTAYARRIISIAITGTTTKTVTVTLGSGQTLTATFTDNNNTYTPGWAMTLVGSTFNVDSNSLYAIFYKKTQVDSIFSTIDGSETYVQSGTDISVTGDGTAGNPYEISYTGTGGSIDSTSTGWGATESPNHVINVDSTTLDARYAQIPYVDSAVASVSSGAYIFSWGLVNTGGTITVDTGAGKVATAYDVSQKVGYADTLDMLDPYMLESVAAATYEPLLGYTPENVANKKTTVTASNTDYPTGQAVIDYAQPIGPYVDSTELIDSMNAVIDSLINYITLNAPGLQDVLAVNNVASTYNIRIRNISFTNSFNSNLSTLRSLNPSSNWTHDLPNGSGFLTADTIQATLTKKNYSNPVMSALPFSAAPDTFLVIKNDTVMTTVVSPGGGGTDNWNNFTNIPQPIQDIENATYNLNDFLVFDGTNIVDKTPSQVKAILALDNVNNTSDATKNSASATLTNKTIDGDDNTLQDIPVSALDISGTPDGTKFLRDDGTWAAAGGGGGVTDGDKGDITISSSGTVYNIDAATVGVTELSATGTPSSSTYLRGDNTWATPTASVTSRPYSYKSSIINWKNTGTTLLFTTEASMGRFIISRVYFTATGLSGNGGNIIFRIGWTAANYFDFINNESINAGSFFNVGDTYYSSVPTGGSFKASAPASTGVYLNITTGGTGTTLSGYVVVEGSYQTN